MQNLFANIDLSNYKVKKERKDEAKLILRERLAEVLGRNKRGIVFVTMLWSEEMLKDSLRACENYSDIKARNYFFNQYVAETKK